jgi:MFS family permease
MLRLPTWDSAERRILAASLVDAVGTGVFLPLTIVYLTRVVGLSPTRVGVGLALAGLAGIVATPVSGALVDSMGPRRVVRCCFALNAAAFVAYAFITSFAAFLAVATAVQVASRMEKPAQIALVAAATEDHRRTRALAWQRSIRNLGYGVGGVIAGLALLVHGRAPFEVALIANALSYLGASLAIRRVDVRPRAAPEVADFEPGYRHVLRDRPYLTLAALDVFVRLQSSILKIGMPLWLIRRTDVPLATTGLLFTLNTCMVVALQVRVSRDVQSPESAVPAYRRAAAAFTVACVGFAASADVGNADALLLLFLAVGCMTIGELHSSAAEWTTSVDLATADLRGRYLSIYKLAEAVEATAGPLVVTALLAGVGQPAWAFFALLLAGGTQLSGTVVRRRTSRVSTSPDLARASLEQSS